MKGRIVNVILSGGSGTRLWPLSRESKPKQFIQMFNDLSLFQHTVNRNKGLVDDFLLVTNSLQINQAKSQLDDISVDISKIIIEPIGRNTAPAIALAALSLDKDDIMIVTPSDHMIDDLELYNRSIEKSLELAEQDFLVTFGIKPTNPNTGFGYIESDGENVLSFREKPDSKTAKDFLNEGNFNWNSGIFCFKASTFLNELKKYNQLMFEACLIAIKSISKEGELNKELMLKIPSDSIDYAVLEKSEKIKTISSKFYWTDLGTFDAIIDYKIKSNKVDGLVKTTSDTYGFIEGKKLYTNKTDLIVVDTEDSIIILDRNHSNEVKELYSHMKIVNPELK